MARKKPTIVDDEEGGEEGEVVETSLRDDLESAYDEVENEEEGEGEGEEGEGEGEGEEGEEEEKEGEGEEGKREGEGEGVIGDGVGKKIPAGINAPIGFSPEAREAWSKVPDQVKKDIAKREQEITEAVANTAEYRRTHTAISNLASSYASILAAEGVDTPMQAIEGLFRTVAELRMGSPAEKARKIAQLVDHYGVDIQNLDQALAGNVVDVDPQISRLEQLLDNRLAPMQELFSKYQRDTVSAESRAKEEVQTELMTFANSPEAEFLGDVREDMADLIELASKHDRKMGFKEAYDRACSVHPTISNILEERKKNQSLQDAGNEIDKKRRASSSIRANSGNPGSASSDSNSLRDDLESAWDAASN